jgi:hypothetical protein
MFCMRKSKSFKSSMFSNSNKSCSTIEYSHILCFLFVLYRNLRYLILFLSFFLVVLSFDGFFIIDSVQQTFVFCSRYDDGHSCKTTSRFKWTIDCNSNWTTSVNTKIVWQFSLFYNIQLPVFRYLERWDGHWNYRNKSKIKHLKKHMELK